MASVKDFAGLLNRNAQKALGVDSSRLGKFTTQADIDAIASRLKAGPPIGKVRTGLYYAPQGNIDTLLLTNQVEVTGPLKLDSFAVIEEIGVEVSTAGTEGSLFTVLRQDRGDGYPGDIVHVSAALAVTTGFKSTTALTIPLTPGLYWAGVALFGVVTTAATVRSVINNSPYVGHTAGASAANAAGYTQSGIVAAPSGAFSDTAANAAEAPFVKLKIKSL